MLGIFLIYCLLAGLLPIRKTEKYIDILTAAELVKIDELLNQGMLHDGNIKQFFDRFALALHREIYIEHALNFSLRARVERFWQGMKNMVLVGSGLLKEHYQKTDFSTDHGE